MLHLLPCHPLCFFTHPPLHFFLKHLHSPPALVVFCGTDAFLIVDILCELHVGPGPDAA